MSLRDSIWRVVPYAIEDVPLTSRRNELVENFFGVLKDDLKAQIGFTVVLVFVIAAIFAPVLAPYDPMTQKFPILQPPDLTSAHPLGTDSYGRDVLSRLIYGARVSLAVGLGTVIFASTVGILVGITAGYYGGWIDDLLMRIIDAMWAFPWLLIAIMLVAIFGQGFWNVVFAVGFAYIDDFARVARSEVLAIREEEYTLAAQSIGQSDSSIIFSEVLPNAIAPLIVQFTIFTASAILAEATLSFLGLGVKPTTSTWGTMLGQGRSFILQAWWIAVIPGLAIMITVLGINLFGDGLRDAFDVKDQTQT
jgi:peptide/nickel transport system permease protein